MAARSPPPHTAYIVAALVGCIFAMLFNFARADCGGFAVSCGSIDVSGGGGLRAICSTSAGGYSRAFIDLNAHISNSNGNLVDGAGFANSCQNIRWYQLGTDNQGIAAECRRVDGSLGSTTLYNVERRVVNSDGNLVWNNCRRRSLLETVVVDYITNVAARKMLSV